MSPPIFNPDGTEVSEIVLPDGSTASQVIGPDGNVVFEAGPDIPDSGDLHARWSAKELSLSDGESVTTWPDETGNGFDLTAGTAPTYVSSGINGNPSVRFDGVDEFLYVTFTDLAQPNHIFIVFQFHSFSTSNSDWIFSSESTSGGFRHYFLQPDDGTNAYRMYAGNDLDGGTPSTNPKLASTLYDGANSTMRFEGSQVATGDAGTSVLGGGFSVGAEGDDTGFTEIDIGEILIYPQDKSSVQSDIEDYLSSEWGITL